MNFHPRYFFIISIVTFLSFCTVFCNDEIDLEEFKNFTTFDSEEVSTENDDQSKFAELNLSSDLSGFLNENKEALNDSAIFKNRQATNLDKIELEDVSKNTKVDSERKNNIQRVNRKPKAINFEKDFPQNLISQNNNFNLSDTQWLISLFDMHRWNSDKLPAQDALSSTCIGSMRNYIAELKNGSVWAAKMNDASGRYSSQFFFGNDFWLGSRKFCIELQKPDFSPIIPPFRPHFYVVKFFVKLKDDYRFPMSNRVLTVGLCLPEDCTTDDIKSMLKEDVLDKVSTKPLRTVNILKVRSVPGQYSLLEDKKLHFLFAVLTAVLVLALIGTVYEISLERCQSRFCKHQAVICNNNEGDSKIAPSLGKLPADKISNEKYNLNNSISKLSVECKNLGGNSVMSQLVLSFSLVSNSRKILNCGPAPEDNLTCIHGLRFLSLSWVIMVHTYLQVFTVAENKVIRTLAERNFMFQTVSNATFSVDTFFFISGLLVTYLYFKSARKEVAELTRRSIREQKPNCAMGIAKFFKLVGYRYIRLTPAYMFVLLIAEISMRWLQSISVFEPVSQNHVSCDKYWWRNILYINSLFPMKDMCMLWSWYVSNDTQFYVIGIVILLFSVRNFRFAGGMLITFLIASWCTTILIAVNHDYRARIEDPFANFDELYDKPWTRLGPYLIGMIAGWYLFKIKCRLSLPKMSVFFGWILSSATLFFLVYGLHVYPLGLIGSALYVSVGHTAWGIALAWIVIACCTGHGGFIDSFLSCPLLQPLSRLTYCAYLIHPIIMTVTNFQMGSPLHLQDAIVLILYLGNITASFIASFGISMLFEAPVVRLLKIIFSSDPKKSANNQANV